MHGLVCTLMDREDMNETVIDGWGDVSAVMARLSGPWLLDRVIEGQGRMRALRCSRHWTQ